jgi:hypothetical protein
VQGLAGEPLARCEMTASGLAGDRGYAVPAEESGRLMGPHPRIMRTVARVNDNRAGTCARVVRGGELRVGDEVRLRHAMAA